MLRNRECLFVGGALADSAITWTGVTALRESHSKRTGSSRTQPAGHATRIVGEEGQCMRSDEDIGRYRGRQRFLGPAGE